MEKTFAAYYLEEVDLKGSASGTVPWTDSSGSGPEVDDETMSDSWV